LGETGGAACSEEGYIETIEGVGGKCTWGECIAGEYKTTVKLVAKGNGSEVGVNGKEEGRFRIDLGEDFRIRAGRGVVSFVLRMDGADMTMMGRPENVVIIIIKLLIENGEAWPAGQN
jgi:hypothetical protein